MMKKMILLTFSALFLSPAAWACDAALWTAIKSDKVDAQSKALFQRDCAIQDRFKAARQTFEQHGIEINDIAEYKVVRLVDRGSWEHAKAVNKMPQCIYPPAPVTWQVWNGGIEKLFPRSPIMSELNSSSFSTEQISWVNQQLISAQTKDIETDQDKKVGELRQKGDNNTAFCDTQNLDYSQFIEKSREDILQVQTRWEAQVGESFSGLLRRAQAPEIEMSMMGAVVRPMGPGCGKDGRGYLVSYVRSDQVMNHLAWLKVFLKATLQKSAQGQIVMPPIELSAFVQRWLVSVHPFADGNGRTSRAIQDMILAHFDLPFMPAGDLLNDVTDGYKAYIGSSYDAVEKMVGRLEVCARELKSGQKASFACRTTAELNSQNSCP